MERLTHGGLKEAWIWDERTHKMLGDVLFNLCSGDPKKRLNGKNDYYELKRHFYPEVFESYIDNLEVYRREKGAIPMRELLKIASKEMVKQVPEVLPPTPCVMPAFGQKEAAGFKERMKVNIQSEQLSLF